MKIPVLSLLFAVCVAMSLSAIRTPRAQIVDVLVSHKQVACALLDQLEGDSRSLFDRFEWHVQSNSLPQNMAFAVQIADFCQRAEHDTAQLRGNPAGVDFAYKARAVVSQAQRKHRIIGQYVLFQQNPAQYRSPFEVIPFPHLG